MVTFRLPAVFSEDLWSVREKQIPSAPGSQSGTAGRCQSMILPRANDGEAVRLPAVLITIRREMGSRETAAL